MKELKSKKRKKDVYPIPKPLLYLLNFRKRVNIVNFKLKILVLMRGILIESLKNVGKAI